MFEGLFQPMHLLVLLGIALLVFGPQKLPELGKGLGDGIRIFKASIRGDEQEPETGEDRMSTPAIAIVKSSDSK
jgi:sec-independent protein translocase protein TatA